MENNYHRPITHEDSLNAILDLASAIAHAEENAGKITPERALILAEAARQVAARLMEELHQLQEALENLHLTLTPHIGEA